MTTRLPQRKIKTASSTTTQRLCTELGGAARLAQLRAAYQTARPKRSRWGPGILTADEVFRQKAKEDGFTEEDITIFIEHASL